MCDTFAVRSSRPQTGGTIFGKNSDREPDETQCVVSIPRRTHKDGDVLTCTYIAIPQVRTTHAMVLSKPFWIWGAEMGVNEHGVVIGNEALFTKRKHDSSPGLIGMDLLRLALERSTTVHQAVQVIIDLLRAYGQAGPCGYRDRKFDYMNSFLIVDRNRIVVLETIGRDYALKFYDDHAAVSNCLTLGREWEEASFQKNCDVGMFEDRVMTFFAGGRARRKASLDFIEHHKERFSPREAFSLLRQHYAPLPNSGFNKDICMHARGRLIRRSQTTGSMVVCIEPEDRFRIFITGSSAPCLSTYKPCLPSSLPADLARGGSSFSSDSYWWRHEVFHINARMRYAHVHKAIAEQIGILEQRYSLPVPGYLWDDADPVVQENSQRIFEETEQMEKQWIATMSGIREEGSFLFRSFWRRTARKNNIPLVHAR